jgi:hypothetical protein
LRTWSRHQSTSVDSAALRTRIRQKMSRGNELYLDGEIDKSEYQIHKAALDAELAILPAEGNADGESGKLLLKDRAELSVARMAATPPQTSMFP